jgi:hypothetical protein
MKRQIKYTSTYEDIEFTQNFSSHTKQKNSTTQIFKKPIKPGNRKSKTKK